MAQEEKNQGGGTLVFVRHGQSIWNATNQFTGWVDCDLSEVGVQEAHEGGKELAKAGVEFDIMYTSYQKRAIKTGDIVLEELDQLWIPVVKSWRLNERMYGALQGLNKKETVDKHGEKKVLEWRRSYDVPPPEIDPKSPYNPAKEAKYRKLDPKDVPKTECLKDVVVRVTPFWESDIAPALKKGKTVLVSAHGNSIRAILKFLDNIPDDVIPGLEIPTGIPLVYRFDKKLKVIKQKNAMEPLSGVFLGDPDKIKEAQEKVKNQIKGK
jgi:2,3-bisphosphoglycerate-dependent phosphoglycerate mutase